MERSLQVDLRKKKKTERTKQPFKKTTREGTPAPLETNSHGSDRWKGDIQSEKATGKEVEEKEKQKAEEEGKVQKKKRRAQRGST